MVPGPETRIGQEIRVKLAKKAERLGIGFKAIKVHANEFTEEGTPDLDICIGGWAVKIETKQPGGRLEPIQMLRLKQWQNAGALTGVCESVEDAMALTEGLFDYLSAGGKRGSIGGW